MGSPPKLELLGLDIQELTGIVRALGQPLYRARQLFQALYRDRISALEQIPTLPKPLRLEMAGRFALGLPGIERRSTSQDGTIRYLLAFSDGESVETVWMPQGDGGEAGDGSEAGREAARPPGFDRATICVSSQVGCAVNCHFCLTALLGQRRNLSPGEIVGQVLAVLQNRGVTPRQDRLNLVFMGMGEPFLNFDNFIKAVRLLVDGVGVGASRMTVSTAGIVPGIERLARQSVRPKLAISLNAPNDEIRSRIMPINRKWNMDALLEAARRFPLRPRERLTFEYVLLDGVNDEPQHARELARRIAGLRAKVNLIAFNPGPEVPFHTPAGGRIETFQQELVRARIPAFVRRPRGRDIYAACGQLKRTLE